MVGDVKRNFPRNRDLVAPFGPNFSSKSLLYRVVLPPESGPRTGQKSRFHCKHFSTRDQHCLVA